MSESGKKLKVVYHEDHSTDVLHTRGEPVVCRDCRFAGWLTQYEYKRNRLPVRCLFYSGGADPRDGDRVKLDWANCATSRYDYSAREKIESWDKAYPFCSHKNEDGQCEDFIRAHKQSWWTRVFRRRDMRK